MSAKNGFMSFLGGAAVGAVVALLLAPEKGEVTRRKLGDAVEKGKDKVVDAFEKGREKIEDTVMMGREKIENAFAHGKQKVEDELAMLCEDKVLKNHDKK